MSIIKSIKQQLGLGPAAENHFWDGSVANQLTLKRGTPDAPGAELMEFLNGVVSFPNQGQLLAENGYVKLPGGLIIQWGTVTTTAAGATVTFPLQFPTGCLAVLLTPVTGTPENRTANSATPSVYDVYLWLFDSAGAQTVGTVYWIAIGY